MAFLRFFAGTILKDIPIKIVINDDSGVIGAARYTLIQKAFRTVSRAEN